MTNIWVNWIGVTIARFKRMRGFPDCSSRPVWENSVPIASPVRFAILRDLKMPQDPSRLIWIDMEMTGLKPDADRIIELALVITDGELSRVAEAPVWVVHQSDEVLDGMDSWNKSTHSRSGLIDKVKASLY